MVTSIPVVKSVTSLTCMKKTLAIGVTSLGVTRSQRINLTECLEIVHGKLVAQEVQKDILQRATKAPFKYLALTK